MDPANRSTTPSLGPVDGKARALAWGGGAPLALLLFLGCGEPGLSPAPPERFAILPGMPSATPGPGWIDEAVEEEEEIRTSRPRICETFTLPQESGSVDVLIVPDIGRSMRNRKAELLADLPAFLDTLFATRRPSIRVGVLGAAPPAEGEILGHLVPIEGNPTPFVTCLPEAHGEPCTHGDWRDVQSAIGRAVDAAVSRPASLGLLAVVQALDASFETQAPFLRDGADLHVVIISDADDLSCSTKTVSIAACQSFEGCACRSDTETGRVKDFVRLLRGSKGHGYEERVRLSAWVATTSDPLTVAEGTGLFVGCSSAWPSLACATPWSEGAACALHAPRYVAAAQATGGRVYDLCRDPKGLEKLGAFVSGVAPEFSLQRKPLPHTIETVLLSFPDKSCNHPDSCLEEGHDCIRGRCGQAVSEGGSDGWQYVSCSSGIPRNMVRFESSDRLRNRKIEICYDVDVGADPLPCP